MRVSRIFLRNFRNFKELDIVLKSPITCLIGDNNVGKTNLLHALRLALDYKLSSQRRALSLDDFHTSCDATTPTQIVVGAEFCEWKGTTETAFISEFAAGETARVIYRFLPRASFRDYVDEESDTYSGRALALADYHWELTGGSPADPKDLRWFDSAGVSVSFSTLQALEVSALPALRNVHDYLRRGTNSPLPQLINTLGLPETQRKQFETIAATANAAISDTSSIKDLGDAIQSSFESVSGPTYGLKTSIAISDPSFDALMRSLTLLVTGGGLECANLTRNGLGLNNLLYVAMLLEYFTRRSSSAECAGNLLFIEEPEAHLHPQLQRVLFDTIASKDVQTFITTHSTHVTAHAPLESYVVLTKSGDASVASSIHVASETERRDIERYLDATRSLLLFAKRILLVEGIAEQLVVPRLVSSVRGIDLDREGIAVVPVHSTHFFPFAKLFGPDGIRKRCAVLADGDRKKVDPATEDACNPSGKFADIENEYVKCFVCASTFERTLVLPGTLAMFKATAVDLKLRNAKRAISELEEAGHIDTIDARYSRVRDTVLNAAKNKKKGRFAQHLARHATRATQMPTYLAEAIDWLMAAE